MLVAWPNLEFGGRPSVLPLTPMERSAVEVGKEKGRVQGVIGTINNKPKSFEEVSEMEFIYKKKEEEKENNEKTAKYAEYDEIDA
eukprot:1151151-Karenia_brevis.AAC.1